MKLSVHSHLSYTISSPATIILNIHAIKSGAQIIENEHFSVTGDVKFQELRSAYGGSRFLRIDIPDNIDLEVNYNATAFTTCRKFDREGLDDVPLAQLTTEELFYLNPSRYCQSDKLYRFADNHFGKIDHAFDKVLAICDWIGNNVQYISGTTNSQTSAFDTITEQAGVCRDFAHLGIALCRASSIPARYFTGYSYKLKPADFHACFEAFLGGHWIIFDATRLAPLNGMVKIASSRDAADAAVATLFGGISGRGVTVSCNLFDEDFEPFFYSSESNFGLSYS